MTALREEYPHTSVETLCSLFGKRRQWYYKKSIFVVSESQRAKLMTALVEHHIRISMTECYKPTDNAVAERMNGILKVEWTYRLCIVHCHPS